MIEPSNDELAGLPETSRQYIADLESEVSRLKEVLSVPEIERLDYIRDRGDGHWQLQFSSSHWAVRLIVESLADTIGDAPNFVTMTCGPVHQDGETLGPYEVTVRRIEGKSTSEVLGELREEVARLKAPPSGYPECTSAIVEAMGQPDGEVLIRAMHANEQKLAMFDYLTNRFIKADLEHDDPRCVALIFRTPKDTIVCADLIETLKDAMSKEDSP